MKAVIQSAQNSSPAFWPPKTSIPRLATPKKRGAQRARRFLSMQRNVQGSDSPEVKPQSLKLQ